MSDDVKIVLVLRKTRLEGLITRFNTTEQARFYIEHLGADFSDYLSEHECYQKSVRQLRDGLSRLARVQLVDREFLPNFLFGPKDLVVALGQDGLVANVMKYLNGQLLIGVNPDPKRWDGVLLSFQVKDVLRVWNEIAAQRRPIKEVTMASARLNDGQELYAVNDLFIGKRGHTSALYDISLGNKHERHSSSGVIVSTGLGSTGWLSSVVTGANRVVSALKGSPMAVARKKASWDQTELWYAVREPFPGNQCGTEMVFGKIALGSCLKIVSSMAEDGVIFSDGMEQDCLSFNSGFEAKIGLAEKKDTWLFSSKAIAALKYAMSRGIGYVSKRDNRGFKSRHGMPRWAS